MIFRVLYVKFQAIIPRTLLADFATLIDLLKLSQITREKDTQISLQAFRCDLITIHDMLMDTIVANQVHGLCNLKC